MPEKPSHIHDFSLPEWQAFMKENGYPAFRAGQVFQWLHQKLVFSAAAMSNLPADLRNRLQSDFYWPGHSPLARLNSEADDTAKFLLAAGHNSQRKIETVWLPYTDRNSVCISVQSGCSLDCSFCASGKLAFGGNLSAGEIVSQVYLAQNLMQKRVSNVVFMGMGEPFHNYENSLKAAHLLAHPQGLDLGVRRISISTSGVLEGIRRFVEEEQPFNLAISVHAVNSEKRARLMAIEKKDPLEEIAGYLVRNRHKLRNNQLTLEYVMIQNMNMSEGDLQALVKLAGQLRAKVNLIPLNTSYANHERPSEAAVDRFWQALNHRGVVAINRRSPGQDIAAACGMLSGQFQSA